jgi:serine/threonine protein kinase/Tol biopolymer transport system component
MERDFRVGDWIVRPDLNRIEREGEQRSLKPKVVEALVYLANHAGEVLHKERLIQAIWPDTFVTDDVLKQAVFHLRQAFDDDSQEARYIQTIPKRGYCLIAEVHFPEEDQETNPARYRLLQKLAEGGMGEIYLAEDTDLGRRVALKFLRQEAEEDEIQHRRFRREARAVAALDHPFICKVYETGILEGHSFIAMEYVEGETLKERLRKGPRPLKETLRIAREMAEAMEASHRKGIVHRDIKPSNVILAEAGHVKITDFGIAKRFRKEEGEPGDWTLTEGVEETVGTPDYMSPEQIRGEPVDFRSDIFSFGIVLYEMVTGVHPFRKEKRAETTAAILQAEPAGLKDKLKTVPELLEHIVQKALESDPTLRHHSASELLIDLRRLKRDVDSGKSAPITAAIPTQTDLEFRRLRQRVRNVTATACAVVVVAIVIVLAIALREPEPSLESPVRKFNLNPGTEISHPVISPDGRHIAYIAGREHGGGLWVQDLASNKLWEIEGGETALTPFWSPASDFIGFGDGQDVRKAPVGGGPAVPVGRIPSALVLDGAWSPDGKSIVVRTWSGTPTSLYEVSAQGGTPSPLPNPGGSEEGAYFERIHFLPSQGERRVILGARFGNQIVLHDLDTGEHEYLATGTRPFYSFTGHVIYEYASKIWALPFSLETLQPLGEAYSIAPNGHYPSVAADGTLVYLDKSSAGYRQLGWRERDGEKVGSIGQPQEGIRFPVLSPDGDRVAVRGSENGNYDIWIHEVGRPIATRLTVHPALDAVPIWSPTGNEIAFLSTRMGKADILIMPTHGSKVATVTESSSSEAPTDWSRLGNYLLYERIDPKTGRDLWYLQRNQDGSFGEPVPFLRTRFRETTGSFSPDGRLVAYASDESGVYEIYVQSFPEGGNKVRVSGSGGSQPRWRKDGREIFYVQQDILMAAQVNTGPEFSVGPSEKLFAAPGLRSIDYPHYDATPDGERFVIPELVGPDSPPVIRVVQNWFSEFRNNETTLQ